MAAEFERVARMVKSLPNRMVKEGNKAARKPLVDAYKRDAGGDGRLSGVPNMKRFSTKSRVRGSARAVGRLSMTPAGPASWLNYGTKPRPQGAGVHPGTRGKRTFDLAERPALVAARRAMEQMFIDAVR